MPYTLSIETTCLCNLKCPECPTGSGEIIRQNKNLDDDLYQRIIGEVESEILFLMLYFQGEPFINEDIFEMIKYASERKIYTVTSTNGQFLTGEKVGKIVWSGLDRLIISIDGTDQMTYEKYRVGGSLSKILEGTKELVRAKKYANSVNPEIIFQFVVFRHNEKQVKEISELGKKIGVNRIWIKSAQVIHTNSGPDILPENAIYTRYKIDPDGEAKIRGLLKNRCCRIWRTMVITTDGIAVPCCFDKNAKYDMGDLHKDSLMEIWKNERYRNFREGVLHSRRKIDICNNCTEGIRVYI